MTAVVLAAGKSKRLGSKIPKVLLPVRGRPLLGHVLAAVRASGISRIIVVVGTAADEVEAAFGDEGKELSTGEGLRFARQPEQKGTADAVLCCSALFSEDEDCVVLYGDTPLIGGPTIRRLVDLYYGSGADVAILTAVLPDPQGYGRITRGRNGEVQGIVEERDASDEVRRIAEVNAGVYAFRWGRLLPFLQKVDPSPVTGEYYLTDAVKAVVDAGGRIAAVAAQDPAEILGVNTPEQLAAVEREFARLTAGTE